MSPGYGSSGVVIAMLAMLHPLGVVAAAVFVAGMLVGADSMSRAVGVPTYIADVIVAASLIAVLVATLMAPVVVELGARSGLVIPLIGVHLFVFYYGIMGDITPPVGLNLYVASGITKMGITELTKAVWPWLLTMLGFLVVVTYVPALSLWLPKTLGMM